MEHSLPAQFAANPAIASLPPEKQQEQIATALALSRTLSSINWIFVPLILLFAALAPSAGDDDSSMRSRAATGPFAKFFALSITVSIISAGFGLLILGVIAEIRGPSSFDDATAVQAVVPGLALLVPGARGALAGFLAPLNVFNLWATALLALGMIAVGRIPRVAAWGTSAGMLLVGAAFGAVGAALHG